MKKLKSELSVFISEKEIQSMTQHLARQVERDYAGKSIVLICPLKGSILFATDFMRALRLEQKFDTIYLQKTTKGKTRILKDIHLHLKDEHVILVEEVIDSGRAVKLIMDHLQIHSPASLKVLTLFDKPSQRDLPLQPDYVGRILDSRYIVGYGTDIDETGRNYRDIYTFKQ